MARCNRPALIRQSDWLMAPSSEYQSGILSKTNRDFWVRANSGSTGWIELGTKVYLRILRFRRRTERSISKLIKA